MFVHFIIKMPMSHIKIAMSRQLNKAIWLSGKMPGFKV